MVPQALLPRASSDVLEVGRGASASAYKGSLAVLAGASSGPSAPVSGSVSAAMAHLPVKCSWDQLLVDPRGPVPMDDIAATVEWLVDMPLVGSAISAAVWRPKIIRSRQARILFAEAKLAERSERRSASVAIKGKQQVRGTGLMRRSDRLQTRMGH